MNVVISKVTGSSDSKNAGAKAPKDICAICECNGWYPVRMIVPSSEQNKLIFSVRSVFSILTQWKKVKNSGAKIILYQHPMYWGSIGTSVVSKIIKKLNQEGVSTIVLIHDLECLRYQNLSHQNKEYNPRVEESEISILNAATAIICHNACMKKVLVKLGIEQEKVISINIFDYLCNLKKGSSIPNINDADIAIAGNLNPQKCGYIYKLANENPEVKISLYGIGLDETLQTGNMRYRGSYTPEELPQKLDAKYGLVWDGPEITTCCGPFGEYLKYNNPHKLSLFMAAGIPVITWKEAAIADFVKEQNVGILVDSLCNLKNVLDKVTDEEYETMKKNAEKISLKVKEGYYSKTALDKAVKRCIK